MYHLLGESMPSATYDLSKFFTEVSPNALIGKLNKMVENDCKSLSLGVLHSEKELHLKGRRVRFVDHALTDQMKSCVKNMQFDEAIKLLHNGIRSEGVIFEHIVQEDGVRKKYAIASKENALKLQNGQLKLIDKSGNDHQYDGIEAIDTKKFREIAKIISDTLKVEVEEDAPKKKVTEKPAVLEDAHSEEAVSQESEEPSHITAEEEDAEMDEKQDDASEIPSIAVHEIIDAEVAKQEKAGADHSSDEI
ncbi:MAG: hypothetical protein JWO53_996, partial [Chlamydiia bacterium]|nr:hypothetical protein [Chlamydiia bacterium]